MKIKVTRVWISGWEGGTLIEGVGEWRRSGCANVVTGGCFKLGMKPLKGECRRVYLHV